MAKITGKLEIGSNVPRTKGSFLPKHPFFNPIEIVAFSGLHLDGGMAVGGWAKGAHLSKICYTYATSMKLGMFILYLKKIKKIYELRDATT